MITYFRGGDIVEERKLRKEITRMLAVERMMQGKSQQEMAEGLGTNKSNISRIENGRQNISVDYIQDIADFLGKSVSFVMENAKLPTLESTIYYLKLYDEDLVKFRMERKIGLEVEILWINEERKRLLPLELELTEDGLRKWLDRRIIPSNREMAGAIMMSLGLQRADVKGIIDICMGLSLNDSYWVVPEGFAGTFSEYNLYENRFDEALSLIAYTGREYISRDFKTSPEFTTGGMLRKAWRFFGADSIWLYKGGTEGYANSGNEPYCEFYAAQVAEAMGINHVAYDLENWKGILASKCRLFTDTDTSYIPIGRIVKTGGIQACLEYYKELGDNFYQELASMLVFDAVVLNEDRHFGNFGLLRNNRTGEITGPAPVFDNGLSLLCYSMKMDYDHLEEYIKERSNPYLIDFIELARSVMGPIQRKQLRKLIGFKFKESDISNLPSWRLHALEEMIQDRVRMLLS